MPVPIYGLVIELNLNEFLTSETQEITGSVTVLHETFKSDLTDISSKGYQDLKDKFVNSVSFC